MTKASIEWTEKIPTGLVKNQLRYHTDLIPNEVIVMYDPMKKERGNFLLKCYKLSDAAIPWKKNGYWSSTSFSTTQVIWVEKQQHKWHSHRVCHSTTRKKLGPTVMHHDVWTFFSWPIRFRHTVTRTIALPVAALVSSFWWVDCTRSNILIYICCLFIYIMKKSVWARICIL